MQEYEDVLASISSFDKKEGYLLQLAANSLANGRALIKNNMLRQILELIKYPIDDKEMEIILLYADENNTGEILIQDLVQQILNAEKITPLFSITKWITASEYELQGRSNLLEQVSEKMEEINIIIEDDYSSAEEGGNPSKIINGFSNLG